ncbi:HdeD family acid-resistance protein [Nocardiopsis tropica]|uniref:HdeD family acid-resistance protein n=1 Tax=Tsukamurella strandjordii TaxID=147577 RepID=UPI0031DE6378
MTTNNPLQQGIKSTWQTTLFLGIVSIVMGAIIAAWPGPTTLVVGVLFGVFLILTGIFQVISGLVGESQHRVLAVISGALSLILGVFCFRDNVYNSITVLGIWIGISWIFFGITSITIGFANKSLPNRVWVIILGILTAIGGFVLVSYPYEVQILVLISGIWAIAIGIVEVVAAFQLRSAAGKFEKKVSDFVS